MRSRPADAVTPGPGQESVGDYPRPPRLESKPRAIRIVLDGATIVETDWAYRMLETSYPPTYDLPPAAFAPGVLVPCAGQSWCEWKGQGRDFDVVSGDVRLARAAWAYPKPTEPFAPIADYVAVYPESMDACWAGQHRVRGQDGGFYGGWITDLVVGPFKVAPGRPGSLGWSTVLRFTRG